MTFKLTFLKVKIVFKQTIQCYLAKMFQLSVVYLKEVIVSKAELSRPEVTLRDKLSFLDKPFCLVL